jgi:uncharacterized protein YeaO (DUF488 family)
MCWAQNFHKIVWECSRLTISVVRLGSPRKPDEGLRLGTVRRPPRGVPRKDFARRDFYDVWLPQLSPSAGLVSLALNASDAKSWNNFRRKFRAEMNKPDPSRVLDLLAALSHHTNFSVGCYCSVLKELLSERGAKLA